jgi:hypothetical protein
MKLFHRGCTFAEHSYTARARELSPRDRLDLERHARSCAECADALSASAAVDAALERAFAPLRERRTSLAPGRVRMALGPARVERPALTWLRVPALFARMAEVSVALGVTIFAVTGTFDQQAASPQPASVIHEYFRSQPPLDDINYFRWLRLQPAPAPDVRQNVRYPAGGRFDVEQVEIVINPTSTPR